MTILSQVQTVESTVHKTNEWLARVCEELENDDRQRAWTALRACLHALRDRLSPTAAARLGAQLPMLLRGLFYEGWDPVGKPLHVRSREEFLDLVDAELGDRSIDPELAARAVFAVLVTHVSEGQVGHVLNSLPAPLRELWPRR